LLESLGMSAEAVGTSVEVDELGSHFILRPSSARLSSELAELRWGIAVENVWGVPAIPTAVDELRGLLADYRSVTLDTGAQQLMEALEEVPSNAVSVAHKCEHRPGSEGILITQLAGAGLESAFSRLPRVRHDPKFRRWWIPASEESLKALGELLRQRSDIAATDAVWARVEPHRQETLSAEAVAGIEHRCFVDLVDQADGRSRLRLCRKCNPDLDLELEGTCEIRPLEGSWWLTIDNRSSALLEKIERRPDLLAKRSDLLERLREAIRKAQQEKDLEGLSSGSEGPTEIAGVNGSLRPFQGAAVAYALRARRVLFADEPGLGKTIEALASLQASNSLPAVVVCPASLRRNWVRECERWLPDRTVAAAAGDKVPCADVVIASYNILHRVADSLVRLPLRGLVLDEAHFCKNESAHRTKAALRIAESLNDEAMVLLLTGTPVVNRPDELATQLRILGRPDLIHDIRRLSRMDAGDPELPALNRRLRRTCFVRRRKEAVLTQLPAKQRVVIQVDVADRAEYERIERDVTGWLREQVEADTAFAAELSDLDAKEREAAVQARGREAAQRARRAETLVKLNKLALASARGKLDAMSEWIGSFLESGKKLVVFARHREIGDRLHAAFPASALATGSVHVDDRSAEVARFQNDPDCRLIICSIDAAGVGLTLTAASDVAFAEMAWTAAAHDQAEDRVHRIGQDSAVTAWYLIAANTIDERIAAVVDRKRELASGASDGVLPAEVRGVEEIVDALLIR
jgi:SNF2 domain-containing protein/helicase-like protein